MRLFGLIGKSLAHSFSQEYFTGKFQREGINNCAYRNFTLENVQEVQALINEYPELEGFNITIPYKEEILPYLASADSIVQKISACNCVRILKGKMHGYNTDIAGFERSLIKDLKPHHNIALILGTGGASKAVAYVLDKLQVDYKIVSRNALEPGYSYKQLTSEIIRSHKLIINTTPLGTAPNVNVAPEIPYEAISSGHYLYDLVYNPAETLFLKKGKEKGATIKNGYEMLVIQAEESWKIWNR